MKNNAALFALAGVLAIAAFVAARKAAPPREQARAHRAQAEGQRRPAAVNEAGEIPRKSTPAHGRTENLAPDAPPASRSYERSAEEEAGLSDPEGLMHMRTAISKALRDHRDLWRECFVSEGAERVDAKVTFRVRASERRLRAEAPRVRGVSLEASACVEKDHPPLELDAHDEWAPRFINGYEGEVTVGASVFVGER